MFTNIGDKIKNLAAVITWIGIIGSILGGIVMIAVGLESSEIFVLFGFLTAIAGSLVSWIGSFLLYGFGELIDRVAQIDRKLNNQASQPISGQQRIEALKAMLREGKITLEEYQEAVRNG